MADKELRIVVDAKGNVYLFDEDGPFDAGKRAIQKILEGLAAEGITFTAVSDVEQHRHDDPGAKVRNKTNAA